MKTLNQRSKNNLVGVHPNLVKVIETAIVDCPLEFTVVEGVRTTQRQQELFAQGRTTAGQIVTNVDGVKKKSNHQPKADGYGYAVDIYANPINVNDTVNIKVVADCILSVAEILGINVEWGGDWKFIDRPHFELKS